MNQFRHKNKSDEAQRRLKMVDFSEYKRLSEVSGIQDFDVPAGHSGLWEVRMRIDHHIEECAKEYFGTLRHDDCFGAAQIGALRYSQFKSIQALYESQDEIFKHLVSTADFAISFIRRYENIAEKWNKEHHRQTKRSDALAAEKERAYETIWLMQEMLQPKRFAALMKKVASHKEAREEYFADKD